MLLSIFMRVPLTIFNNGEIKLKVFWVPVVILQEKKATKYLSTTLGDSIYNNLINQAKHQRPEIVSRYVVDAIRCLGSTISHHIIEETCPGLPNEGKDLISKFGKMISKGMFTLGI